MFGILTGLDLKYSMLSISSNRRHLSFLRIFQKISNGLYTELDARIVFNDETLIDVLPILKERGLLGTLPVVSRNGSPEAVAAVKRGDSLATYDYGLPEMGIAAGKVFKDIFLNGADLQDEIVCPTYGRVIDEEAAERYIPWDKRAPAVELITGLDTL